MKANERKVGKDVEEVFSAKSDHVDVEKGQDSRAVKVVE